MGKFNYNTEIIGKKINTFRVVKCVGKNKFSEYIYECKCDCGNIKEYTATQVRRNKSCGCQRVKYDFIGRKIGELTVVKFIKTEKRQSYWLCECTCGNFVEYTKKDLISGGIKSCGHILRQHGTEYLKKNTVDNTNIGRLKSNIVMKTNTSGVTGVSKNKNGKWVASITFQKKQYNLGTYDKKKDAIDARKEAEERLHKDFLRKKGLIE